MASRGQSAQAPTSAMRRYAITFSDGKKCTALDMQAEPEDQAIRGISSIFREGYVVAVEAIRA